MLHEKKHMERRWGSQQHQAIRHCDAMFLSEQIVPRKRGVKLVKLSVSPGESNSFQSTMTYVDKNTKSVFQVPETSTSFI